MTGRPRRAAARLEHRTLPLIVVGWFTTLVACGGAPPAAGDSPAPRPAATDTRTPIEQRRDTACDQLGPKLTACAVEDGKAALAAGKITQAQLDRDISPAIQRRHTEEFLRQCKTASYSSRQIRVLEVCFREEARCAPLLDCLGHLDDAAR